MTNYLVSILMLSHNNGVFVEKTVRGVIEQTYLNPFISSLYTFRNGCYGIWKWLKYKKGD